MARPAKVATPPTAWALVEPAVKEPGPASATVTVEWSVVMRLAAVSSTFTWMLKVWPGGTVDGALATRSWAIGLGRLVRAKLVCTVATCAVTVQGPAGVLAVSVGAVAMPWALDVAVAVTLFPANRAPAPVAPAVTVKVTVSPE